MAKRAAADPKLQFAWNSQPVRISGEESVTSLTVRDSVSGEEREIRTDAVFEAIGHVPRSALFIGQIALDEQGYVVCEGRSTRTSVEGVFACGDVVDHTYRQAITAAGSGCQAALDAERYLAELSVEDAEVAAERAADQHMAVRA